MHVQRDVDQFLGDRLAYHATLLVGRKFQKFLTQVIAERIWYVKNRLAWYPYLSSRARTGHEISEMAKRFTKDHITMFRDAFLQFLLQIPTTMLILAQRWYFTLQILQGSAREAID
jgi:hypothetical protein